VMYICICSTEDVSAETAKLTTDVKVKKQELLRNVVLDLQMSGERGM